MNRENTELSNRTYKIAETETFITNIEKPEFKKIYKKIKEYIYPILRKNPFFGPNIKRLKGKYSENYRYRIGDYRLFYKVQKSEVIIYIIDIIHRKRAY